MQENFCIPVFRTKPGKPRSGAPQIVRFWESLAGLRLAEGTHSRNRANPPLFRDYGTDLDGVAVQGSGDRSRLPGLFVQCGQGRLVAGFEGINLFTHD